MTPLGNKLCWRDCSEGNYSAGRDTSLKFLRGLLRASMMDSAGDNDDKLRWGFGRTLSGAIFRGD